MNGKAYKQTNKNIGKSIDRKTYRQVNTNKQIDKCRRNKTKQNKK